MAILSTSFLLIFTLITINFPRTTIAATNLIPKKIVSTLIHRDSKFSPNYNPNKSFADRAKRALHSSSQRFCYLSEKASGAQEFRANLTEVAGLFYVKFSIGEPPVPQYTVLDTGSDDIWVNCLPCDPCSIDQSERIFDPEKSSSFSPLLCPPPNCTDCEEDLCQYDIRYIEGAYSSGFYATEQLTFETSNGGTDILSDVIFGCGLKNGFFGDDGQATGVFGLGFKDQDFSNLLDQLNYKFSYCIGNMNDPNYAYSHLILGDRARMVGHSTPMAIYGGLYYIRMKGISVGDDKLVINQRVFEKTRGVNNGVLIDCGSQYTWLVEEAYRELKVAVENLMNVLDIQLQPYLKSGLLCYYGNLRDLTEFPTVTFHFAKGADLVLDQDSLFIQSSEESFCMAIGPSTYNGEEHESLSMIGILAQQHYNVGYDLRSKKLFFHRIDCKLLE